MTAFIALIVHVALSLDSSIHSTVVKTTARTEAAAIWRAYDVALTFGDEDGARLCIAAFVDRQTPHHDNSAPAVLGSTFVFQDDTAAPAPVRIGFDDIDELAKPTAASNAMLHEYAVGTAIGRVLAHEIGHILLGPPGYHDAEGLMRSNFATNEFLPWNRARYRLAPSSVARLHERVPALSIGSDARGCLVP